MTNSNNHVLIKDLLSCLITPEMDTEPNPNWIGFRVQQRCALCRRRSTGVDSGRSWRFSTKSRAGL